MRVQNMKVKITIPIPVEKPDKNGVVFTKAAIENAISNFPQCLPIIFRDNNKCTDEIVIGSTADIPTVVWDNKTQTCSMTINGFLFYGGAEIKANEIKDKKVTDFDFTCIGLTV